MLSEQTFSSCDVFKPGVIESTCQRIDQLEEQHDAERRQRYARRNRIRFIDDLLNEFELLNLAEEHDIPVDLTGRAHRVVVEEMHPISSRSPVELRIADWMEALYDVQDTLMLPVDDDID